MATTNGRRPRTLNEERAYGGAHRKRRKVLLTQLEQAGAALCPKCELPMTAQMRLHLDHSDPLAKQAGLPGDTLVHATCNEGDGGRIGMAIMRAQTAARQAPEKNVTPEKLISNAEINAEMERREPHRAGCKCHERIKQGWRNSRCW